VDLIVSSTAARALSTAKEFVKKMDYKKDKIRRASEIYLAEMDDLLEYVKGIDDDFKTVMLFGHNPSFTWFANYLTNGTIENVPTCGMVAIDFNLASWNEISGGTGALRFFEYPKLYFKNATD
jgi:phosphohistidine phosphatase